MIYNKGIAVVNILTLNTVKLLKSSHCRRHKENRQKQDLQQLLLVSPGCVPLCLIPLSSPICFLVFHFRCSNVFLPLFALFYQQLQYTSLTSHTRKGNVYHLCQPQKPPNPSVSFPLARYVSVVVCIPARVHKPGRCHNLAFKSHTHFKQFKRRERAYHGVPGFIIHKIGKVISHNIILINFKREK